MKIQELTFLNYKGIENSSLSLSGKSTIIFGENGCGKSSVLEAVNSMFTKLIYRFSDSRIRPFDQLERTDITIGKSHSELAMSLSIDEQVYPYTRNLEKNIKRSNKSELERIGNTFKECYLENQRQNMPIFVSYGTQRAVQVAKINRIRKRHEFEKVFAFENAIEKSVDFRMFFEWFRNQQELENMQKVELEDLTYQDPELLFVKQAILYFLGEDFSDLKIVANPLRMIAVKQKTSLRIEQLSDGEKCLLALIGDLARRLVIANPSRKNRLDGEGIVLIDEIELHLHPTWQASIFQKLRSQFPNIQFIITTHSPKVLQELQDDVNLIYASKREQHIVFQTIPLLHGWDTNKVYELYMNTDSMVSSTRELINEINVCIENSLYDQAREKILFLQSLTDELDENVVYAKTKLTRFERKKQFEKRGKHDSNL